MTATGRCLCGEITFAAKGPLRPVLHCHCVHCRRATGNFVAATGCARFADEAQPHHVLDSTVPHYSGNGDNAV